LAIPDSNTADPTDKADSTSEGKAAPETGRPVRTSVFSALAAPQYRRFWFGSLASVGATQLLIIGQGVLVFDLSGSEFLLGLAGAVTGIATIIVTLFGGVVADRVNKRMLLAATSLLVAGLLFLLATLDVMEVVRVWHVIAIASAIGIVVGFDSPARQSIFPLLIDGRDQMMSAVALNSVVWQGTRIIVPAIGGFALAYFGTHSVFFAGAVGFTMMFFVMLTIRLDQDQRAPGRNVLSELWDGVRYVTSNKLFAVLIPVTYANMFFGVSYMQLIPVFADAYESQSDQALGFLFMLAGVGSLTGTFAIRRVRAYLPVGWLMILGSTLGSASIVALGVWTHFGPDPSGYANPILSPMFFVSTALMFFAGTFNSMFLISSMTVLQLRVPVELRGRVMGIYGMTFSLIPVGGLLSGSVAQLVNASFAVALSAAVMLGIMVIVTTIQPVLRQLRAE
jgi:MFS family permease